MCIENILITLESNTTAAPCGIYFNASLLATAHDIRNRSQSFKGLETPGELPSSPKLIRKVIAIIILLFFT